MIYVTIGLLILTIASFTVMGWCFNEYAYEGLGITSFWVGLISLIITIVFGVDLLWGATMVEAKLAKMESTRESLEGARQDSLISPYELATIQKEVLNWNEWLADAQFWADGFFAPTYPEAIKDVQPIR